MSMLTVVSIVACALAVICLLLFAYQVLTTPRRTPEDDRADQVRVQGLSDVAKLVEAFAKLTDSLQKAGPMIGSLVGAMFFLLVAALSAGLAK